MSTVLKKEDKFNGKTFYQVDEKLVLANGFDQTEIFMKIEYLELLKSNNAVSSKQTEVTDENYSIEPVASAVRILIELQCQDWWFLNRGSLVFLADNNIIDLGSPAGRNSWVGKVEGVNKNTVVCNEHCVYLMSKEDLKKICDAQKIELQLSGAKWKTESELSQMNADLFRLLYNNAFDNSLYNEVVSGFNELNTIQKNFKKRLIIVFAALLVISFILIGTKAVSEGTGFMLDFFTPLLGVLAFFIGKDMINNLYYLKHRAKTRKEIADIKGQISWKTGWGVLGVFILLAILFGSGYVVIPGIIALVGGYVYSFMNMNVK
ncbi:MAG: hypothetical protein WCK02_14650 [Bacteroidota bacterium]